MKCKRFSCFRARSRQVCEFKGIGLNYNRSTILKTFDSKSMLVLVISLIVLVCLSKPVCGKLERVRWKDLSEHLEEESTPLLDLNVCDCPENIEDLEPPRVVAQFIENTFYLWEEYEVVTDAGVTSLCIIMKKPKTAPLSAEEAQILLTASSLWIESESRPEDIIILDPLDARLNLQPIESLLSDRQSFRLEVVIGADERTRITDTTSYPWNTHCYLELYFPWPIGAFRGTGCLVSPYMVLTCGHCVYDREEGVFVDSLTVTPGQTQEYEGGLVIRPYGTREGTQFRTDPSYHTAPNNNEKYKYDYGAVLFDTPFSNIDTYMPVEFSANLLIGDILYSAGYPGEVNAETNSKALWNGSGSIVFLDEGKLLWYNIDTTGSQSGSPLCKKNGPLDPGRIVGIHAGGGITLNAGPRLGVHNKALITEWMEWTPDGTSEDSNGYYSEDIPKIIPDPGTMSSTLVITNTGTIVDLNVNFNISHTWDSDLDVHLIAPDGTQVELFTDVGGSGDDFNDTILDDECLLSIKDGLAPFTGRYRSEGNLGVLDGKPITGTWTLELTDDWGNYSGTLNSWCLIIEVNEVCPLDPPILHAESNVPGGIYNTVYWNDVGQIRQYDSRVPEDIPDPGTATSTLVIDDFGTIEDLNIKVDISHSWNADLDAFFIPPDGDQVELFTDVGDSGDDFKDTILDDKALVSVTEGSAPFTGSYRPEGSLDDLIGIDIHGTWTLEVTDDLWLFSGTLNSWSLIVDLTDVAYYAECATDTDFGSVDANSGWIIDKTYTFTGLDSNQEYSYRVKARPLGTWSQTSQADFETDTLTDTRVTSSGDVVPAGGGGIGPQVHVIEDPSYELGTGWTEYSTSNSIVAWRYDDWASDGTHSFEVWCSSLLGTQGLVTGDYGCFRQTVDLTGVATLVFDYRTTHAGELKSRILIDNEEVWSSPLSDAAENEKFNVPVDVSHITGIHTLEFRAQAVNPGYIIFAVVQYDNLRTYGADSHVPSGSIISPPISIDDGDTWDIVVFNVTTPAGTTLTVDILPATGLDPIPGYANILSGTVLSDISERTIRLRANLSSSDPNVTPALHDWSVTYTKASCESDWSNVVSSLQCQLAK